MIKRESLKDKSEETKLGFFLRSIKSKINELIDKINNISILDIFDVAWYDARKYATDSLQRKNGLAGAINKIGSANKTILITSQQDVPVSITVSANITLKFLQGGFLNIDSGKIVTINGDVEAGLYQIFKGSGTVTFGAGSVKEVYPQWWGATGDNSTDDTTAIQAAMDGTPLGSLLFIPKGIYLLTDTLARTTSIHIQGAGRQTVLKQTGSGKHVLYLDGTGAAEIHEFSLRDFSFAGTSGTGDGLKLAQAHRGSIENVYSPGVGAKTINSIFSLLNTYKNVIVSTGLTIGGVTAANPTHGLVLDGTASGGSNANTFIGCNFAGITTSPGIGVLITSNVATTTDGNVFIGGSIEANTVGFQTDSTANNNLFWGVWQEANTTDRSINGSNNRYYIVGDEAAQAWQEEQRTMTEVGNILTSDYTILGDATTASFWATLPTPSSSGAGKQFLIKKTDSTANIVTINQSGAETIDGANTYPLRTQYQYVKIESDGTNWHIVASGVDLQGSGTWDAGSIAVGAMEATDVTVTGAALGDFAIASLSLDLTDLVLDAQVTTSNTVTCVLSNNTAGAVDLASATIYVKVIKK